MTDEHSKEEWFWKMELPTKTKEKSIITYLNNKITMSKDSLT